MASGTGLSSAKLISNCFPDMLLHGVEILRWSCLIDGNLWNGRLSCKMKMMWGYCQVGVPSKVRVEKTLLWAPARSLSSQMKEVFRGETNCHTYSLFISSINPSFSRTLRPIFLLSPEPHWGSSWQIMALYPHNAPYGTFQALTSFSVVHQYTSSVFCLPELIETSRFIGYFVP